MALKFNSLTRLATRALKPGERIQEHGIIAECLASGDIRYKVNVMVDGVRHHRVIGNESAGVTRDQAMKFIEALRTKAREDRLDLPKGRKVAISFEKAAEDYIKRLEEGGGKNIKIKRRQLDQQLKPAFGSLPLDRVGEFDLKKYRKVRLGAGASEATINREMATLSHLLRSAVEWKWIKRDAIPVIPKAPEPMKAITILDDQQSSALMDAARADQDERLWLFVAFGLNTAMRHREILAIRYDQIDFDARRIFIASAKAGARQQPITDALRHALLHQRKMEDDKAGWVFPTLISKQSKGGHRTNMARPFMRAVERAGLDPKKVTPHTMRHTAITRLVKAGIDLPTIQRISGHKTLAMVLRYTHVHGSHIDAAIMNLSTPVPDATTQELHTALSGGGGGNTRAGGFYAEKAVA